MSYEEPISNCVDCQIILPLHYQFDNLMRCPSCEKKFIAMSKEERIAANREIARRFREKEQEE